LASLQYWRHCVKAPDHRAFKWPPVGRDFGQDWQQKGSDFLYEARQVTGLFAEPAPMSECTPLQSTCGVIAVRLRKADGFGFNCRSSVPKRRDDRINQTLAVKRVFDLIKSLPPTLKYEPGMIVADGDLVIVHGRFSGFGAPANWIAADIWRIQDGILVEHWDVIQDEVTIDQSKSGLPMFGNIFPKRP
jgi:hypothetical protein